jgi:hypothetical protein
MAAYQIQINERTAVGKNLLTQLRAVPDVVTLKKAPRPKHSKLYYDLKEAFQDVKDMMDGKKPKRTIQELICELRSNKV